MKKIFIILLITLSGLFAQTNKSITLVRNQTDTTFFVYSGDLRSETIYLTAKKDSKISSPRLIDHLCDSISYSSGLSTLYFYMLPVETSGIDLYRLRYDVMIENSSSSHTILFWGDLNLKQGVRLDSDDAPTTPTPIISYNLADSSDLATVSTYLGITDPNIYTESQWNAIDTVGMANGYQVRVIDPNGLNRIFVYNKYLGVWQ